MGDTPPSPAVLRQAVMRIFRVFVNFKQPMDPKSNVFFRRRWIRNQAQIMKKASKKLSKRCKNLPKWSLGPIFGASWAKVGSKSFFPLLCFSPRTILAFILEVQIHPKINQKLHQFVDQISEGILGENWWILDLFLKVCLIKNEIKVEKGDCVKMSVSYIRNTHFHGSGSYYWRKK